MKKHIWPRNARKNYDPRKMLTHVKNIFTNITHVKIWPTQPTHPRNPGSHATHVTTQPTRISKVFYSQIRLLFAGKSSIMNNNISG